MNCKDGVSVRAYSVGWLSLLSSRQFLRPPLEEVANQCHASAYYNYRVFLVGAARCGETSVWQN